jgi:hypothetical protein
MCDVRPGTHQPQPPAGLQKSYLLGLLGRSWVPGPRFRHAHIAFALKQGKQLGLCNPICRDAMSLGLCAGAGRAGRCALGMADCPLTRSRTPRGARPSSARRQTHIIRRCCIWLQNKNGVAPCNPGPRRTSCTMPPLLRAKENEKARQPALDQTRL